MFIKFRNKHISYDLLRARGAYKKGYAKYVVLDDFIDRLNPRIVADLDNFEKTYRMQFNLNQNIRSK